MSLNARVLERLKEELTRQAMSQRDLSRAIGWSQSKVAKILAGHVELSLNDLAALCHVLEIRPTEAVRDAKSGEFWKELAPTDFRIVELMEQHPKLREIFRMIGEGPLSAPSTSTRRPAPPLRKKSAKAGL